MHSPILAPVAALVAWSMVMWAWMIGTRVPAIIKARMRMDRDAPRGEQMSKLPALARWKADNYNHLMEQPTLFYAIAIVLALVDPDGANRALAWTYVGLRVVHSLVQALFNKIELRFAVFSLSSRLGLGQSEAQRSTRIIVFEDGDELLGFFVDEVREVVRMPVHAVEPPPQWRGADHQDVIRGVGRIDSQMIILLEFDTLVSHLKAA